MLPLQPGLAATAHKGETVCNPEMHRATPYPGLAKWLNGTAGGPAMLNAFSLLRGASAIGVSRNPARNRAARMNQCVWLVAVLLLALMVLWPVTWVAMTSLRTDDGDFTLANYQRVTTSLPMLKAAGNSLILASSVGILSIVVAAPMAWAVARTDMPLKGLVRVMVLGSLVTPGFLTAMAWILLAGPNSGLLNLLYVRATGAALGPLNIFTMEGMIFVTFLECYPFAFILISSALRQISPDHEDAANILGASTWQTMRRVVIPLAFPAIVGGFILAFTEALVLFSAPAMIGVPAQVYVLTTQIWSLFQFPPEIGVAAAISLPLLAVTVILLSVQKKMLSRRGFATVTGKASDRRPVRLGKARWPVSVACLAIISASVGITYIVLFLYGTTRVWGEPLGPQNFTLEHFELVLFGLDSAQRGIVNSLTLGVLAATAAVLIGGFAAFCSERRLLPGSGIIAGLAMAPLVIPGIIFAVGLFAAYTRPPLILYGTLWILFLAYATKFLPLAYMSVSTSIKSVGVDLEDAGRILGAGNVLVLTKITAPLIRDGVVAGWLLVFVYSMRELSSSILLFTNDTIVVAVSILDLYDTGAWQPLCALGCVLLVINLAVIALAYRLFGLRPSAVRGRLLQGAH